MATTDTTSHPPLRSWLSRGPPVGQLDELCSLAVEGSQPRERRGGATIAGTVRTG